MVIKVFSWSKTPPCPISSRSPIFIACPSSTSVMWARRATSSSLALARRLDAVALPMSAKKQTRNFIIVFVGVGETRTNWKKDVRFLCMRMLWERERLVKRWRCICFAMQCKVCFQPLPCNWKNICTWAPSQPQRGGWRQHAKHDSLLWANIIK